MLCAIASKAVCKPHGWEGASLKGPTASPQASRAITAKGIRASSRPSSSGEMVGLTRVNGTGET